MKFLKTLQKKQIEKPFVRESVDGLINPGELVEHSSNAPPDLLADGNFKIGTQHSPFFEPPDSFNGKIAPIVVTNGVNGSSKATALTSAIDESLLQHFTVDEERANPHIVAITQPRSAYCEQYRSLRTHILLQGQKQPLRSIVVVSVGPSEGKSVTALNLSWLLAQTDGIKALIIDSDLRRPSLAVYLGIEAETGLSEVLAGKATLKSSIVRLRPAGLYLLSGGEPRSDVAELISGPRFNEILREARGMFDYVIIDAPPLGIFSDAAVLINLADGALLVVRANQTSYKDIDRVLDTLPRERILGTILNQSSDTLIDESYYKYGIYDNI